jgi:dihydrolipoamide dehydrogenase
VFDLIVIGAGPGGYEAAAHAGRMGKKVALVEKGQVGGSCLNVGCIPAKTFLRSARLYRDCREAAAFGVNTGAVSRECLDRHRLTAGAASDPWYPLRARA